MTQQVMKLITSPCSVDFRIGIKAKHFHQKICNCLNSHTKVENVSNIPGYWTSNLNQKYFIEKLGELAQSKHCSLLVEQQNIPQRRKNVYRGTKLLPYVPRKGLLSTRDIIKRTRIASGPFLLFMDSSNLYF